MVASDSETVNSTSSPSSAAASATLTLGTTTLASSPGPAIVLALRFDSFRLSVVQIAPRALQLAVGGNVTVTAASPSGATVTVQSRLLSLVCREAASMLPPATSKAWSSSVR